MNFNPALSTGAAVSMSLLAAFFWGSWFISLKYLGKYPIDGYYMTLFTTSLILVWAVAILFDRSALWSNLRGVYASDPARIYTTVLSGVLYVIGIRIQLIVMQKIGLSLSQPIMASINVLAGTLISGLVGGIPSQVSRGWIVIACAFLVSAVIVSMIAGNLRSQVKTTLENPDRALHFSQKDLWQGLALLVVSTSMGQSYTYALSYGLHSVSQPHGMAVLPFMATLVTGAFIGALLSSGLVLTLQHQWSTAIHAPFSIHKFGILSGLAHYGGNIIHTFATVVLSSVVSWPLGVTMGLWTQFWGLVYGEFKGSPRKVYITFFSGIGLYLAGASILAFMVK
jgi:hypothetical protein